MGILTTLSALSGGGVDAPAQNTANAEAFAAMEEAGRKRTELAETTKGFKGKVNAATTYPASAVDFQNFATNSDSQTENLDGDPPLDFKKLDYTKITGEQIVHRLLDLDKKFAHLTSLQTPENEAAYHDYYNGEELRNTYEQAMKKLQAELRAVEDRIDWYGEMILKSNETGSRISENEVRSLRDGINELDIKSGRLENAIYYLKHRLAPENEMYHFCYIDERSPEVLAAEEAMGIRYSIRKFDDRDRVIHYLHIGDEKRRKIVDSKNDKYHVIALNKNGDLIFDKIDSEDNQHYYIKFRENNGLVERWVKTPNFGWEKRQEYPLLMEQDVNEVFSSLR